MDEVWKDIPEYKGIYQISNLGRVRSLERDITDINGITYHKKARILKPSIEKSGYVQIKFGNVHYRLHRLVAEAFIPNPDNLPCINHKDENKANNCVDNLEWCTHQYNNTYNGISRKGGEKRKGENNQWFGKFGKEHNRSKTVYQYSLDDIFIAEFGSCAEASRKTGVNRSDIIQCRLGHKKTAGGYKWKPSK